MTSGAEAVLFWCLAPLMTIAALGLLFARKAVHATLCVVFVMISLAVLYVANEAPFLGIVQVVVYTGAVMMLFLFVIMLVGVDASDSLSDTIRGQKALGWLAGLGLGAVLVGVLLRVDFEGSVGLDAANEATNPAALARVVFSDFVFDLEVVGILLITAAIAGLTLTHKQRLTPLVGQKERADARVAAGESLVPLPAPGVYAQRNAMDVPALDPYGQPIVASVSRVLRIRGQERTAPNDGEWQALVEQPEWTALRLPLADEIPLADPHGGPNEDGREAEGATTKDADTPAPTPTGEEN
jgi:NADH-quinone oxidoreductase subunit J